jgi:chromosome segregation ATPase
LEHFETQRQEYNQKIDRLQLDGLDKDRQLAQLQLRLERQQDEADRRKQEHEMAKAALEKERKALAEKLEAVKKKLSDTQDEAMRQKLDLGREQALARQQVSCGWLNNCRSSFSRRRSRSCRSRWTTRSAFSTIK